MKAVGTGLALLMLAGAVGTAFHPQTAQAQDLSGRPIRMLVGLAAGGATDVMARVVAQKMSEGLHTPVVVENKAGGNFILALRELTSSPPDGHTLFFISTSTLIAQPLYPNYPFDLTKLTPITEVATGPLILVVRKDLPVKNLQQLVAYAKQNPGKLSFGAGGGSGSSLFFATELLKMKTGITAATIPYRGAGPALNDLLGGHIDGMFDAMPVMSNQVKAGTVTPIAVTSAQRSAALPAVPTVMEQGVPDYEIAGWFGMLAPTGTPPAIAQRLREEVAKAVAAPDVIAQLDSQGMQPLASQPAQWHDYLEAELGRYAKIIKDANIKPDSE
ncbi:MAG TPA: tripartite tricarboxylate transporter substrate binding protein [Xanthobacteraceae bacterium]|nr:tripartite tricarboxylate transporter substrate binding protein [Xanthobacteraceae bacterium]